MTDEQKAVEQVATPRTDELLDKITADNDGQLWRYDPNEAELERVVAHSRQLERELTAANAQCEALKRESAAQHMIAIRADHERRAAESLVSAPPEGMVEVPVTPTERMIQAGAEDSGISWNDDMTGQDIDELLALVYKAMIAARPVAAPLREALADLQEDADRLDWLLKHAYGRTLGRGASDWDYVPLDTREKVDAARALLEDK